MLPQPPATFDPADFAHLREYALHPEELSPPLYAISRHYGHRVELRHQSLGGNPDGMWILITPEAAIHVVKHDELWHAAYNERRAGTVGSVTKREPLDIRTKRRNPFLYSLIVDCWLRRITWRGGK